jgi:hypothetical protein
LFLDFKQTLSKEELKQTIYDFFKKIHNPPQPTHSNTRFPHTTIAGQFAFKSYTDNKTGETDAQYETRLALPDGW